MSVTQNYVGTLVIVPCYKCGTHFGMDKRLHRHFKDSGESFYCPNGHFQSYIKSEVEKLKEKLELSERNSKFYQEDSQYYQNSLVIAERRISAQKGVTTKLKKRISNGVCIYCHRTVSQMSNHVKTQHPECFAGFESKS